ncbi:MAG: phosphatase PAP2 family protein [Patescibacteria group bacterium]
MGLILEKFNVGGFRFINDLAGHNVWLDRFMVFAADKMGYLLVVAVLIVFWKKDYFKRAVFVSLGSAIVARFAFVSIFRYLIYSPRPFLVLENVNQLMNHEFESSFPSGHASFYFALAMGVYFYNKRAGYIFLVLAGLMGLARIFIGVHWPLDILAGAGLGIATTVLVDYLFTYLKQKMPLRTLS